VKTTYRWKAPAHWLKITTLEAHTAGEPLRIVTGGLPEIPGKTILEKRRFFRENLDHLRTGLLWEPRGHADMYGAVLTDPVTPDGDFGVIFLHNEGYSTMCGHGIIALTHAVLDTGMVDKPGEEPVLRIDTPSGRVTARAIREKGVVRKAFFLNVPSFVLALDRDIPVGELGRLRVDIAFGGAFYAFFDADALGLALVPENHDRLIHVGRVVKKAVMDHLPIVHPFEPDLGFLYGSIAVGKPADPAHHSRNVCVFAEGELDRSPTGTGLSARAAIHYRRGELPLDRSIIVESILGTTMEVRVAEVLKYGDGTAVIPEISASASLTGEHTFYFDPRDELKSGFIFR
jgi:trans-L-3-hydroxyproline dehydratase